MLGVNKIPQLATLDVGGTIHADSYIESSSYIKAGTTLEGADVKVGALYLKNGSNWVKTIWYE